MTTDLKLLEKICLERFPKNGKKLYEAMTSIRKKDFCVATAWNDHEVSISRSCALIGRVFKLSEDYKKIFLPVGGIVEIQDLSYKDISLYLPYCKGTSWHGNCFLDSRKIEEEYSR